MTNKTCNRCGEIKPLSEFYKNKGMRDGHLKQCKECSNAYFKKYRQENAESIREFQKKYAQKNAEKLRDYQKKYRQENAERLNESSKKWGQENAEKKREANKRHYQENKARYRELQQKWQQENPERLKALSCNSYARRRARKVQNGIYKVTNKDLVRMYEKPCVFCGEHENIQIDHVIPIAKGGVHGIGNLQTLCQSCNSKKSDKYMMQFKMECYG